MAILVKKCMMEVVEVEEGMVVVVTVVVECEEVALLVVGNKERGVKEVVERMVWVKVGAVDLAVAKKAVEGMEEVVKVELVKMEAVDLVVAKKGVEGMEVVERVETVRLEVVH